MSTRKSGWRCEKEMNQDFSNYVADAERFAIQALHWMPDHKQREALRYPGRRAIYNWGRQCGKSAVMAVRAVHWGATRPESTILVMGGSDSHTAEFVSKVDTHCGVLGWKPRGVTGKRVSRLLPNGSRIIAETTNVSIRGHAASLVILDECAYIRDAAVDAVLPTLAVTGGTLYVCSTPNGNEGRFADLWRANTGWFRSEYKATDNPRISKDFLDEVRRLKGDAFFRQEFLCEFLANGRTILNRENIDELFES